MLLSHNSVLISEKAKDMPEVTESQPPLILIGSLVHLCLPFRSHVSLPLGSGMKEKWILDFPLWLSLTSPEFKKYPEASLAQPQPRIPKDQSRNPTTSRPKNIKPLSLDTDRTDVASSSGKGVGMALARLVPSLLSLGGVLLMEHPEAWVCSLSLETVCTV